MIIVRFRPPLLSNSEGFDWLPEDYFDDHEKAVKIFKSTIERLDIELDAEEYGE